MLRFAHPTKHTYFTLSLVFRGQVKRWGILWRPLSVPLKHTTRVLHAVVRLHNFVRLEQDDAPDFPGQPAMTANNTLEDELWATPAVGASGAYASSVARNEVLRYITRKNLRRPDHNIARNNAQNAQGATSQA